MDRVRSAVTKIWPEARFEVHGSFATGMGRAGRRRRGDSWRRREGPGDVSKRWRRRCRARRRRGASSSSPRRGCLSSSSRSARADSSSTSPSTSRTGRRRRRSFGRTGRKVPRAQTPGDGPEAFLQQRSSTRCTPAASGSYALLCMVMAHLQLHDARTSEAKNLGAEEGCLGALLIDFFELYGRRLSAEEVGVSCRDGGRFFAKRDKRVARPGEAVPARNRGPAGSLERPREKLVRDPSDQSRVRTRVHAAHRAAEGRRRRIEVAARTIVRMDPRNSRKTDRRRARRGPSPASPRTSRNTRTGRTHEEAMRRARDGARASDVRAGGRNAEESARAEARRRAAPTEGGGGGGGAASEVEEDEEEEEEEDEEEENDSGSSGHERRRLGFERLGLLDLGRIVEFVFGVFGVGGGGPGPRRGRRRPPGRETERRRAGEGRRARARSEGRRARPLSPGRRRDSGGEAAATGDSRGGRGGRGGGYFAGADPRAERPDATRRRRDGAPRARPFADSLGFEKESPSRPSSSRRPAPARVSGENPPPLFPLRASTSYHSSAYLMSCGGSPRASSDPRRASRGTTSLCTPSAPDLQSMAFPPPRT